VPLYHSRDLRQWRLIGHALTRKSQLDLTGVRSSAGILAPTLRHHDGTFYLVTTLVPERGNFVVTAKNPAGPWSDPVWLDEDGFDPSLTFDDGRIYYTRDGPGSDRDHPFIYQGELDSALALVRKPRAIWKGTGGVWPEGPHLYRRDGWYYLLTAEGGTSYGHSVVAARARRPYGLFEASPHGPLVTHRDRPRHPIQATGHADLVDLEDGTTWAVLLAIRPATHRHNHIGRETFVTRVSWDDEGWPRLAPLELGPEPRVRERIAFWPSGLPDGWLFVRNPAPRSWSLRERPGFLRLWGSAATLSDLASPALVCRRQQHLALTARTRLDFEPRHENEQAGLCIRQADDFHVALLVGRDELKLVRTLNGRSATIGRTKRRRGAVTLEVRASAREYAFRAGTIELGRVQTRSLSAETILERARRHHFTGATIGLYATGAGAKATVPADFHWFEYASR
jgi:xylan 1,4-beta-xylosidase